MSKSKGRKGEMFQVSAETSRAVTAMLSVGVGEIITWDALHKAIGVNPRPHADGNRHVRAARRILEREHQAVFSGHKIEPKGIGLKRLDADEVVKHGSVRRKKMRNQTTYLRREYKTIEQHVEDLPTDLQADYAGNLLLASIVRYHTHSSVTQRRNELAVSDRSPQESDLKKALKAVYTPRERARPANTAVV